MKKLILLIALLTAVLTQLSHTQIIDLRAIPEELHAGDQILIMENGTSYLRRAIIDIQWDEVSRPELLLKKTNNYVKMLIPENSVPGNHSVRIILDDGIEGAVECIIKEKPEIIGDSIDGYDPNPESQNGKKRNVGENPHGIVTGTFVTNPSGGHGNEDLPCDQLHKVDGRFTDSVYNDLMEWDGIAPLQGRFSNLYLDYCNKEKILYVMNDWKLGNGNYDSLSCYNLFEFKTGGGAEQWYVKVWNAVSKGVVVIRNGEDVSEDTNYVIGGAYGFAKSLLDTNEHTMWEFGLKVQSGLYTMRLYKDEVGMIEYGPTVQIICDEDGVEGYGLVQSPEMVIGVFDNRGSTIKMDNRYIPVGGVAGLELEPVSFGGTMQGSSIIVRGDGSNEITNTCSGEYHIIDGEFTEFDDATEWENAQSAKGKYSNLYAEYCNGTLYILNDWVLGMEEPFGRDCYNLFELYTADGREHWGIFVYHDIEKGIKVFLNGEDVSEDTSIVRGGAYGFGESPLESEPHTIYEFGIEAGEGGWHLYMCDPGPSSFCDEIEEAAPRAFQTKVGIRKYSENSPGVPGDHYLVMQAVKGDIVEMAFGTYENTALWYSSGFKAVINYNPEDLEIMEVLNSEKAISSGIDLQLEKTAPGQANIIGKHNGNFNSVGDLFVLRCRAQFEQNNSTKLQSELYLSNSTTYMLKSGLQEVTLDMISSVDSENSNANFEIIRAWPNPVDNDDVVTVRVRAAKETHLKIEFINTIGETFLAFDQKLVAQGIHEIPISIRALEKGAYFLKVSGDDSYRIAKIIIE